MELASEAAERYDLLLASHFPSTWHALEQARSRCVTGESVGARRVLRPSIQSRASYEQVVSAASVVEHALSQVTELAVENRPLRAALGIRPYVEPFIEIDVVHGRPSLVSRLDGVLEGEDIRFFDPNPDSRGVVSSQQLVEVFASLPITRELAERYSFTTSDTMDLALLGLKSAEPKIETMALLSTEGRPPDPRWAVWSAAASKRGLRLIEATLDELEDRGGRLVVGDRKIDVVVIPGWMVIFEPSPRMRWLLHRISNGVVRTLTGISRGIIGGCRALFELLSSSEYEHLFDRDTNRVLRRHVPWTRLVRETTTDFEGRRIDLLPFVSAHRERFVLKLSMASEACPVVGAEVDSAAWERALSNAKWIPTIVQERVRGTPRSTPLLGNGVTLLFDDEQVEELSVFSWNDVPSGMFARVGAPPDLAGGVSSTVPVWIVEGAVQ